MMCCAVLQRQVGGSARADCRVPAGILPRRWKGIPKGSLPQQCLVFRGSGRLLSLLPICCFVLFLAALRCAVQVTLGVRAVDVSDYEIITLYRRNPDGTVSGHQRTAVYLDARAPLYFQAAGRAVALFEYDLTMERVAPDPDAPFGAVACVPTPKDVVQCI